jgi:hypothetical protein
MAPLPIAGLDLLESCGVVPATHEGAHFAVDRFSFLPRILAARREEDDAQHSESS